ncbi:head maturation protease, ClpP-related [Micromonospora echinospora]|uniref:head maturation protease, ClpP-related n=1 Tax=Micromonospora echinospora TaxID=1877 RepID=UPI003792C4D6
MTAVQPRTARPLARFTEGRRDWYRINNLAGTGAAEVWVYDEIGWFGVSAQDFVRELTTIKADKIDLHISSPGGDVFDGLAIYQALRNHPAQVTTYVDSLAASAASFIAMAGDVRVIAPHAQMMIHEAWGMCIGNAAEMAKMQEELDRLSANLAGIYANRAGGDAETWRAAMRAETWYSAEEAVAAGLADRVQEDTKAASADERPPQNRWDLSIFAYAGREKAPPPLLPRPVALAPDVPDSAPTSPEPDGPAPELPAAEPEPINPEPEEDPVSDLSEIRSRLGLDDTADEAAILAALDERLQPTNPDPTPEPEEEPTPEPTPAPTPTPQPAPTGPAPQASADNPFAAELARVSAELAEIRAREAAAVKAAVLDGAVKAGKIKPAERASWESRYDKAPDVITDVLNSIADGTAVPVAPSGYTGQAEQSGDLDAEWEREMSRLDGPTATTGA